MKTKKVWRVEVEWQDSTILIQSWADIPDILARRNATRCLSVGFVLADDKKGIVLAASLHGSQAAGVTMIPKPAVVSRKRLR